MCCTFKNDVYYEVSWNIPSKILNRCVYLQHFIWIDKFDLVMLLVNAFH